jgi:hypothetical protein
LSCWTYGGGSLVKTLNQTSFHMWWMVRVEAEVSASVGGVSCRLWWLVPCLP